jgi:hypothetical protein
MWSFLTCWVTISFSRRTPLRGVTSFNAVCQETQTYDIKCFSNNMLLGKPELELLLILPVTQMTSGPVSQSHHYAKQKFFQLPSRIIIKLWVLNNHHVTAIVLAHSNHHVIAIVLTQSDHHVTAIVLAHSNLHVTAIVLTYSNHHVTATVLTQSDQHVISIILACSTHHLTAIVLTHNIHYVTGIDLLITITKR